jgi:RimJ/RimL family protein N-acetyltransferase
LDGTNGTDSPIINIVGELVMLGPMEREHFPVYQRWLNDFETLRTQGAQAPMPDTLASMTRWYDSYVTGRDDVAWFTVYEKGGGRPVGWTELTDIDHRHGTAEFAIMIGEPDARGRGYGTETARLMLHYGFQRLGLHNIHLYYMAFNPAAGRAYEKAGFREYGRRTQAHVADAQRWDVVYMQCLASEFER